MYKFNLSTLFRLQVRHLGGSIPAEMQWEVPSGVFKKA